jgi:hypothetical protein
MTISKEDKALIKTFVDNKPLMEAVRRAMTAKIYEHGGVKSSTVNFIFQMPLTLSNAEYGEKAKVMVQALVELENSFQAMVLGVAAPEAKKETKNEAR